MLKRYKAGKHLSRAEKLFARGYYDKARSEFDKASELNPQDPAIHLRYSVFLAETNDLISAVSHVERALAARPKSAPYRLFYGRILLDFGRIKDAKKQFAEAVKLNPESQLARDYLALIEIASGDVKQGLGEMASAGLSQNTGFHARALVVLEKITRFGAEPKQSETLDVPEEEYPQGGLLRNWRSRGLLSEGIHLLDISDWKEAVRKFRRARALAPDLSETVYQEGVAHFMAGDYAASERIMQGLVDEGDEPALYYGASLAEQGRLDESIRALEKVTKPTPEYHYYLGLYLLHKGEERESRYHFEQAADKRHDLLRSTFEQACRINNVDCKNVK
jgi:tetratricopeptide (TPR) repeat protein